MPKNLTNQRKDSYVQKDPSAYTFILSDLHLPVMDGLELFAKLNQLYKSPFPERWLTTGAFGRREELIQKEGISGVLVKPFDLEQLLRTARAAISRFHHPNP